VHLKTNLSNIRLEFGIEMPPKRTTKPSAGSRNPGHARHLTSTHPNEESIDDSEVFDDQDDALADDNAVEQAPKKATGKKAAIAQSTPSVPSELATSTTQGRMAFDVRYFFNIPDKTCYRCT
jgi:hypothetical protein